MLGELTVLPHPYLNLRGLLLRKGMGGRTGGKARDRRGEERGREGRERQGNVEEGKGGEERITSTSWLLVGTDAPDRPESCHTQNCVLLSFKHQTEWVFVYLRINLRGQLSGNPAQAASGITAH